ncbi:MAG: hypothetical protein AOA66_0854 [Candidatus Bathyarchaeota archaeon BA2]|nr:MAG: hypothetical protein AOA66_0854 [Candidatus Bathyarchaeota archaeon BA2]
MRDVSISEETTTEKIFRSTWFWILAVIALGSFLLKLYESLKDLSLTLNVTTTFFIFIVLILLQRGLPSLESTIAKDFEILINEIRGLSRSQNPNSEKKGERKKERGEVRTSGGGAFAGMIAGGALGLLFGPVGVIVGGVLGAILGDRVEYESIRAERERMRRK